MSSAATNVRLATPSIFTRTFMLGIMGTLSMYLTSWENSDRVRDNYLDKHRDYGDTFDFIIVGGGTAGSILANRLSEDYKVLMLEAGGDPHPFQRVPLLSNWLLQYSQLDWKHITMPQKQAFKGSTQSRASISQGRGLGGTSNLDYMMYLRGHPKDFDEWADLTKDSSWSYDSVLKYFKSLEQYSGPWEGEYHGDSGEMRIKRPAYTGLGERFCHAAQQNGYPQVDLNGPFVEGCDILTYPTKKGYRDSVHSSFLRKIKDHWNLAIHKYAHVNKILIKGDENRAKGVEYDRHGKAQVAYATKEIIVTAGAIQTAKILMLSGIGQRAELDSLGIPVIADLPVGKRLQDHLSVYLGPFFVDTGASLDIDRDVSAGAALSLARDNGPLTTTGFQAAAVISSGLEKLHGGRNWPDLQLTMYGLSHHKSADEDFSHAYHLKKDLLKTYFEHSKGSDSFSIVVSGGRPKSSGTVKLLNRNPYAPLIINPNYFDKVYDLVVMVDGVKKAIRLVENSTVFHDINARLTNEVLPGCETFRFRSDAYWECYVKTMSVSFGNVAGTAAMGSVVDSNMRVIGLKGLRVMDASIMPSIVSTSTGAAVMMIAEKGADLLLKQWQGTQTEGGLLKDTNLVLTKIKENASKMKGTIDSSKAFLETLKLAGSNPDAALEQIDMEDLKKLTQSVGSLAAILGPARCPS
ncbi:Glucose dehydrogenase [FAD, quinone] [Orchesella cincta]|uniref:Glucose dehydrogenase [FAD, quinone] n=1 Tax=Orchesella cincta TaxID=48709 RepID=A0A1D2NBN9_ORCCI|nr:Glucose dehydrogenase [FAD, quinone] [Orchesella cincta]